MQHEPGMGQQPFPDRRRLMGRGVVEDEMDLELWGNLPVEGLEELLELDRMVA